MTVFDLTDSHETLASWLVSPTTTVARYVAARDAADRKDRS